MEASGRTSSLRDNHARDLDLFWGNWLSVEVFCCCVDWFSISGCFLFTLTLYYVLELLQGRLLAWTEAVSCVINLSNLSCSDLEGKCKTVFDHPSHSGYDSASESPTGMWFCCRLLHGILDFEFWTLWTAPPYIPHHENQSWPPWEVLGSVRHPTEEFDEAESWWECHSPINTMVQSGNSVQCRAPSAEEESMQLRWGRLTPQGVTPQD